MTVRLDGGELEVEVGEDLHVNLTGWAVPVYAGELSDEFARSCVRHSKRLDRLPPYLFAELERKIAAKKAAGVDVIALGIGDPDTPTPQLVVDALARAAARPGHAPVPVEPRAARVPRGRGALLRAPLRRASSTRRREIMPALGGQGVHLQPQPGVPRPRGRGAGGRPRLPASTRAGRCSPAREAVLMPLLPERGFAPDLERRRRRATASGRG